MNSFKILVRSVQYLNYVRFHSVFRIIWWIILIFSTTVYEQWRLRNWTTRFPKILARFIHCRYYVLTDTIFGRNINDFCFAYLCSTNSEILNQFETNRVSVFIFAVTWVSIIKYVIFFSVTWMHKIWKHNKPAVTKTSEMLNLFGTVHWCFPVP